MSLCKTLWLLLEVDDYDQVLIDLYELLGVSRRSAYELDGEAIVDLEWEDAGVIVTFNAAAIEHIRMKATQEQLQECEASRPEGFLIESETAQNRLHGIVYDMILRKVKKRD